MTGEAASARKEPLGSDFWVFYAGRVATMLGSSFTRFAIPLLVLDLTGSATALGVSLAVSVLPYLLFGLTIGALVDSMDRKRLLVAANLAYAAVLLVIPALAAAGLLSVPAIYAVLFVTSSLGVVLQTGEFAGVAQLVPPKSLARANASIQAASAVTGIVGPILAGLGAALVSLPGLLVVDAATFLLAVLSLLRVRRPLNELRSGDEDDRQHVLGTLRRNIAEGVRFVLDRRLLRAISVMMALVNLVGAMTVAQLPLLATAQLDAGPASLSWLYAAGGVGVALTALAAARLRALLRLEWLLLGTLALDGVATVVLGLARSLPVALIACALSSGLSVLFNIYTTSLRQTIVPERLLGRVMTVASVVAWSAVPVGAVLGGIAATSLGAVGPVFMATGVATTVIAVVFFLCTSVGSAEAEVAVFAGELGSPTPTPAPTPRSGHESSQDIAASRSGDAVIEPDETR